MIKSDDVYTLDYFCDKFLGIKPSIKEVQGEIRQVLDEYGFSGLWDYPLMEADHILLHNIDCVLVSSWYKNDAGVRGNEVRWVELPDRASTE